METEKKENKKEFGWVVNLIGWVVLIVLLYFAWLQVAPLIKNLNFLTSKASKTFDKVDRGATQANEVLDKVNHPVKNIEKFNPF